LTPERRKRTTFVYLVLGSVVGGIAGLIAGALLFENRPMLVEAAAAAGALIFGVLGVLFKERVVEFLTWY
jgi:zinc transporter ZupT